MMDRNQRSIMNMHIRRLGDGDKAQYLEHFKESREVTVGQCLDYYNERRLDILRDMGGSRIPAGPGVDGVSGGAYVSAAEMAAAADALNDNLNINRNMFMDWTSRLLGKGDKNE